MSERHHLEHEMERNGSALRALAWSLVRDPDTAEDLVQDTWTSWLVRPPSRGGSLQSWFAAVLRNLARKYHRTETRRSSRERIAARDERVDAADELAMRRETLRRVVDALLALDEPYQSVLMLRYFEGLSPSAIASRTETKLATVKSRLQRGLKLLRVKLGEDRDGRGAALLPLVFGNPPAWKSAVVGIGGLLMSKGLKLSLAALVLLVGGSVAVLLDAGDRGPVLDGPALALDGVPAAFPPPVADRQVGERRQVAAGDEVTWDGVEHLFEFELGVRVVDEFGLPVVGAEVEVGPSGGQLNTAPGKTDAMGLLRVQWRGKRQRMSIDLALGGGQGLRRLSVDAGSERSVFLGARVGSCASCHASPRQQRRAVSMPAGVVELRMRDGGCAASRAPPSDKPPMEKRLHPFAVFTDATAHNNSMSFVNLGLVYVGIGVSTQPLRLQTLELGVGKLEITEPKLELAETRPDAVLTGVVLAADGKPAAATVVTWRTPDGAYRNRVITDHDGRYRLEIDHEGTVEVRAGGGDHGLRAGRVQVVRGQTVRWGALLSLGAAIRGRAVGDRGAALSGWRVEYDGTDKPWFDACSVGSAGDFVLPNVPGGLSRLLLWDKNVSRALPVLVEANAFPDATGYRLQLDPKATDGTLRVSLAVPPGAPGGGVHARIWQESTGRGASLLPRKDGTFERKLLVADQYRIEVRSKAIGWTEVARTWVDGSGVTELSLSLPEPGRLVLEGGDPESPPELYARRTDVDVRVTGDVADDAVWLAPGDYWCVWRSPGKQLQHRPFSIRAGMTTRVQLR